MSEPIIIDQSTDEADSGYAARKLWEKLFRLTNAHEWPSLHDFLCDLRIFTRRVDQVYDDKNFTVTFYWYYDSQTGWTAVYDYEENWFSEGYKITIDRSDAFRKQIIIESIKR